MTTIALAIIVAIIVVPLLPRAFMQEFRRDMERYQPKRRFTKPVRKQVNGRQQLTEEDLAELEGMFGDAGDDPKDY